MFPESHPKEVRRMNDPKKWWLISDENIQSIRKALGDSGHEDTLHGLESGLHKTDEIPDDWKRDET